MANGLPCLKTLHHLAVYQLAHLVESRRAYGPGGISRVLVPYIHDLWILLFFLSWRQVILHEKQ
jgi:hypothetical protein